MAGNDQSKPVSKPAPWAGRRPMALLSVFHKTGIVDFAKRLVGLGFDLIASGGTARALRDAGFAVRDVAELVGGTAILGHRVVTLSREVHAGLLAEYGNADHIAEMVSHNLPWIDLVCVDLYPLAEAIAKSGATRESVIEKTDVGGPAMLRSALKGRRIVVCDPADRARVIKWLEAGRPGEDDFVNALCAKAEGVVADYCLASARFHSDGKIDGMVGGLALPCCYGENPSWTAEFFAVDNHPLSPKNFKQVGGKYPSFINGTDLMNAAWTLVQIVAGWRRNFSQTPMVAVAVKHGNACGVGVCNNIPEEAIVRMIESDKEAIHGACVVVNFSLNRELATILRSHGMPVSADGNPGKRLIDVVAAPEFSEDAGEVMERRGGKCRMYVNPALPEISPASLPRRIYRPVPWGGFFREEGDPFILDLNDPRMEMMGGELTLPEREDLVISWAVGSTSVSNTITLVKDRTLIANAVGQQSRVRAAKLALEIAKDGGHSVEGAMAYSDSFFPFPDGADRLASAGIGGIFASSGSVNDQMVLKALEGFPGLRFWRLPDKICRGFARHG